MKLCPFDSVGLVVTKTSGEVLVLERKKFPLGLALPAGHLDFIGDTKESFEVAARRELYEETGLRAKTLKLLVDKIFHNLCSKGFDGHHWQIFEVVEWEGEPRVMEPDKHARVWWATPKSITDWIRQGKATDPAWLKFIFPLIGG